MGPSGRGGRILGVRNVTHGRLAPPSRWRCARPWTAPGSPQPPPSAPRCWGRACLTPTSPAHGSTRRTRLELRIEGHARVPASSVTLADSGTCAAAQWMGCDWCGRSHDALPLITAQSSELPAAPDAPPAWDSQGAGLQAGCYRGVSAVYSSWGALIRRPDPDRSLCADVLDQQ